MTLTAAPTAWDELLAALRDELAQFGTLLTALTTQRDRLLQHEVDSLWEDNAALELEVRALQQCEERVHRASRALAATVGLEGTPRLPTLCAALPVERQPLLGALLESLARAADRATELRRQNGRLAHRAQEVNTAILRLVQPGEVSTTYRPNGRMRWQTATRPAVNVAARA